MGCRAGDATVTVPRRDSSPPAARIVLRDANGAQLAAASQPLGGIRLTTVRLTEPRLIATTVGRDENGGIARVRISIKRRTTCNGRTRPEVGYYPPPQIERIRSNPGANLPTEKTRTRRIALAGEGCTTHGEVWGEAINGSGLEAVTPHIRFTTQF